MNLQQQNIFTIADLSLVNQNSWPARDEFPAFFVTSGIYQHLTLILVTYQSNRSPALTFDKKGLMISAFSFLLFIGFSVLGIFLILNGSTMIGIVVMTITLPSPLVCCCIFGRVKIRESKVGQRIREFNDKCKKFNE